MCCACGRVMLMHISVLASGRGVHTLHCFSNAVLVACVCSSSSLWVSRSRRIGDYIFGGNFLLCLPRAEMQLRRVSK